MTLERNITVKSLLLALSTLATVVLIGLSYSQQAQAGTASIYACRAPDQATPIGTDHWQYTAAASPGLSVGQRCSNGESMYIDFAYGGDAQLTYGYITFSAPTDTTISGLDLYRVIYGTMVGGGSTMRYMLNLDGIGTVDYCGWGNCPNPFEWSAADFDTGRVVVAVGCDIAGSDCPETGSATGVNIYRAKVLLRDSTSPSIISSSGDLNDSTTLAGTKTIAFNATDSGLGIYKAVVLIDDQEVASTVVDDNDGDCEDADTGDDDDYQFIMAVPCKLSTSAVLQLDTTEIEEGEHSLQIKLEDATGNSALLYGPSTVTVDNAADSEDDTTSTASSTSTGSSSTDSANTSTTSGTQILTSTSSTVNGENASRKATVSTKTRTLNVGFKTKPSLSGRLVTENGDAIKHAELTVLEKVDLSTYEWVPLGKVVTDSRGYWSYTAPAKRPSRTVRLAYKADSKDAQITDYTDTEVKVAAAASLRVNRKSVKRGHSVRLSGRLRGEPYPQRGKLIDILWWNGRKWLGGGPGTIRAKAHGKFSTHVKLAPKGLKRAATVKFKVRLRAQSEYPYELGYSNTVKVKVHR